VLRAARIDNPSEATKFRSLNLLVLEWFAVHIRPTIFWTMLGRVCADGTRYLTWSKHR